MRPQVQGIQTGSRPRHCSLGRAVVIVGFRYCADLRKNGHPLYCLKSSLHFCGLIAGRIRRSVIRQSANFRFSVDCRIPRLGCPNKAKPAFSGAAAALNTTCCRLRRESDHSVSWTLQRPLSSTPSRVWLGYHPTSGVSSLEVNRPDNFRTISISISIPYKSAHESKPGKDKACLVATEAEQKEGRENLMIA